jgi:Winged helix-turn helix
LPYPDVVRAMIVLMAAEGLDHNEIAAHLDTRREAGSKWRKRFFTGRLGGLRSVPGKGGQAPTSWGGRRGQGDRR